MKRLALVLISAAAVCTWGQQAAQEKAPTVIQPDGSMQIGPQPSSAELADAWRRFDLQQGCPVRIVDAAFERSAQVMLTAKAGQERGPSLRLRYFNRSDKEIQSVSLRGWIKVKDSPYQLDSVTREFNLEIAGPANANAHRTEVLKLVESAIGFDRVELRQITYTDGSTWKAVRKNCVFRANDGTLQVEAK